MGYIVTDGVSRHEFDTLKEALEFRLDSPIPVYRSDNLGNLKRIPMEELSAAVQVRDYGHVTPHISSQPTEAGHHINSTLVLTLGIIGLFVALALIWFALGGAP